MLGNQRAFMNENQWLVRWLSSQILGFSLETHLSFGLTATNIYVTLHNSQLFTHGIIKSEGASNLSFSFESSNENIEFH